MKLQDAGDALQHISKKYDLKILCEQDVSNIIHDNSNLLNLKNHHIKEKTSIPFSYNNNSNELKNSFSNKVDVDESNNNETEKNCDQPDQSNEDNSSLQKHSLNNNFDSKKLEQNLPKADLQVKYSKTTKKSKNNKAKLIVKTHPKPIIARVKSHSCLDPELKKIAVSEETARKNHIQSVKRKVQKSKSLDRINQSNKICSNSTTSLVKNSSLDNSVGSFEKVCINISIFIFFA